MPSREAVWGLLGTVLSAVAFALAFPPTRFWPLAWVALAPFFVALRRGSWRRALGLTWLWCLVAAYGVGDWFASSVAAYFDQPMAVAIALFFAVFTAMAGPYYLAAALAYRTIAARGGPWVPLLGAAAWVLAELGRGRLFTGTAFFIGNPWGLLGYAATDLEALTQIASITGIYGITFALAGINVALAELWISLERRRGIRSAGVGLALACLPPLAFAGFGLHTLRGEESSGAPVGVAVVQGNVAVGARWRSDAYGENLDLYLSGTRDAVDQAQVEVAFWPEAALTFFLEEEPTYRAALGHALARMDLQLVAGGPRVAGEDLYSNSVYLVEPGGELAARYDKEYLVPFAESFPLGIDVLRRTFGRIRVFEPGTQVAPLPTRAGRAGILVCNESMLPEVAGARVRAGAEILVNPSNDTWISDPKYTEQQLDIARMRAIEQRRWLVRASTSGPSALVDPFGRLRARTPGMERAVAVGEVVPRSDLTPYARLGDAFAFACVAAVALALVRARFATPAGDP